MSVLTIVLLCAVGEHQHEGEHPVLLNAMLDAIYDTTESKCPSCRGCARVLIDLLQIVMNDWPS